jgi:arylsulfatase A-like enzyme
MDAWVGARLDELAEAGLADETVVFFFSDHGVGLPRGKRSPYDLGTRVPLLVRLPGVEGRTEGRVVSFVDFGPTVLSLAGIDPAGVFDGVPFLGPYARAGDGLAFAHADRFDAVYDRARSVTDGRFRLVRNYLTELPHLIDNAYARRLPMRGDLEARRGDVPTSEEQWQVVSDSRPVEELYDSATDPWETHDRIDDPALAEVRLRLTRPERRMVEERLWRGEIQPVTATPRLVRQEGGWAIECTTEGASLGWRVAEDDPWRVFDRPFVPPEVESIELYAHRIGFEPAAVRVALTSRTPDDR